MFQEKINSYWSSNYPLAAIGQENFLGEHLFSFDNIQSKVQGAALMAASLLPNDKLETATFAPDNSSVKIGENVIVERGARPVASFCAAIQYGAEVAAQESSAVLSNSQGERLIGFLHIPGDSLTYQSRSNNQFVDKCLQNIESMEQPAKDRLAALISSYCADRGIAQPGSADTDSTLDRHKDNRQVIGLAIKGYFDEAVTASKDRDIHILLGGFEGAFGSGVTRVVNNPSGDFVKNDENIIKSVTDAFEGKASVLNSQSSGVISFQIVSELGSPVRLTIHQKLFTTSSETVSPGSAGSIFHAVKDTSPDAILLTGVGTYIRGSSGPSCYVAETVIRPNLLTAPDQEERLYKSDFLHNESLLRVLKKGE